MRCAAGATDACSAKLDHMGWDDSLPTSHKETK